MARVALALKSRYRVLGYPISEPPDQKAIEAERRRVDAHESRRSDPNRRSPSIGSRRETQALQESRRDNLFA